MSYDWALRKNSSVYGRIHEIGQKHEITHGRAVCARVATRRKNERLLARKLCLVGRRRV